MTETSIQQLLTYRQLSEAIGVKLGTLYSWKSRGLIPFIQGPGRDPRFRLSDIEAWIEASIKEPKIESKSGEHP